MVCWTNSSGDFTPAWRACSAAMAASNERRNALVWMWTRWPEENASCSAARCCAGGCASRGVADRPWKKNARDLEPVAGFVAGEHRRRSDGQARLVDWQTAAQHQFGIGAVGVARLSEYGPAFVG